MQMIPRDSLNPKRRCQPEESGTTRGVRLHPGAVKVQPNTRTGSPMRQEKKCPFFEILKTLGEHWPVKGLAFLARGDQSRDQHRNQRVRRGLNSRFRNTLATTSPCHPGRVSSDRHRGISPGEIQDPSLKGMRKIIYNLLICRYL